jgi:hypothetical protein
MERMKLDMISHDLRLNGAAAYRATLLQQADKINELQEQVEELQNQLSAEIMARLAPPSELREIVEELGNGWRIERSLPPSPTNPAETTTVEDIVEDIERQMAGVKRLVGAYQRAFIQDVAAAQQSG